LNKFREEYRRAVDELPKLHMDAGRVRDDLHHRRMQEKHRRMLAVKGCAAAAVFLFLGAGTAAARNYWNTVLEMQGSGYTVTGLPAGEEPMAARMLPEESGTGIQAFGAADAVGGVEDTMPLEEHSVEEIPMEEWKYESYRDFLDHSLIAGLIPDISILQEEFAGESVYVMQDEMTVFVRVTAEGKYFCLRQFDYRQTEGFSSSTAYTGETVNQRNLTNYQGLSYLVFDTMGEGNSIEATHAVILTEGRELSMDFYGFEPEHIEGILNDLDLSVYFSS